MTHPVALIQKKRDGHTHSAEELSELVTGFLAGTIADYQMSAWLMAAWLRGLSEAETFALTDAMLHSGRVLKLPSVRRPKIDKHSTGGVGDKVTLCLMPLVAVCGVAVPTIAGRGLGHTGGTLDKLEAIAGFQTRLSAREFERVVRQVGTAMIGQTDELAPADRRIYSLRDVTGTVESVPLITASILSKKLAEGIGGLVLDVKVGRGAFMQELESARALARSLVRVGRRGGKKVTALLTNMDLPLGRTIGNALETREAIEVLRNEGPADTRELTLALGVEMLLMSGLVKGRVAARRQLERALADGSALDCFGRMVAAQGGDRRMVDDPGLLPTALCRLAVSAPRSGWVTDCDPLKLAWIALEMGAGRRRAEDSIDPAVGLELSRTRGERVEKGEPLAWLHLRSKRALEAFGPRVLAAFTIGKTCPSPAPLVLERLG